jgi:nucleoid-associated protein YgaU
MFGSTLDTEQAFGHRGGMHRTYVRRRRVTLALVALGLAAVLSGPVARAVAPPNATDAMAPVARRTYVVRQGDTLWSIASRASRGSDPRPLVDAIEAENGIGAADLVPGMTLSIPAG